MSNDLTPDFLNEQAGKGYDNVTSEDYQIPFLKILQTLSSCCDEEDETYIEGAKPGLFMNSLNSRIYGDSINIIPFYFDKTWLEWKPNRGGLVGQHKPKSIKIDTTDFSNWTTESGNVITEHHNFYCVLPDYPEDGVLILSLSSSGIKHAKFWQSMISNVKLNIKGELKQAPFYSSIWNISISKVKGDKGTYFAIGPQEKPNIKRISFISKDQYINYIKDNIDIVKSIEVNYSQVESDKKGTDIKQISDDSIEY